MGFWDVGPFDNSAAEELVADLRLGRFRIDQFRFRCTGAPALDADDAAVVIALNALIHHPCSRPPGIGPEELRAIDTPLVRAWLKTQLNAIFSPEGSPLYAHWEAAGEAREWLRASQGRISWSAPAAPRGLAPESVG